MTRERPKLLLIDDDHALRQMIRSLVESDMFELEEAASGHEGIRQVAAVLPDVVLLDLSLPDLDGLQVAQELRAWTEVPIIVLSARDGETDKIEAFQAGADDYLTKPFSVGELLARIRVALRHGRGTTPIFQHGGVKVDLSTRQVWRAGIEVHLTPHEFELLSILVKNAGRVVKHEDLLRAVWGEEYVGEYPYLRVYMGQLRHKLEATPGRPKLLTTEPGVGYRLRCD
jgi:two-component system KDP operon response regulator KdpE